MDKNKEKCKELKEIRRQTAENLGVELNQTECTYSGKCRGTCPKCKQEEEKLNKALLGSKVAVAAIASTVLLAGCNSNAGQLAGDVEVAPEYKYEETTEETESNASKAEEALDELDIDIEYSGDISGPGFW